jgi:hypothetical protein
MSGQNFGERVTTSGILEPTTDHGTNSLLLNSDPIADHAPVDEVLVREALMDDGTIVAIDPMDETIIDVDPIDRTVYETPIDTNIGSLAALLNLDESEQFRAHWNEIQGKFVDEPRSSVQQADALVSEVIEKITQMFADEHSSLEGQWKEGNNVSTEDLRKALQHYRSFFNRMVV